MNTPFFPRMQYMALPLSVLYTNFHNSERMDRKLYPGGWLNIVFIISVYNFVDVLRRYHYRLPNCHLSSLNNKLNSWLVGVRWKLFHALQCSLVNAHTVQWMPHCINSHEHDFVYVLNMASTRLLRMTLREVNTLHLMKYSVRFLVIYSYSCSCMNACQSVPQRVIRIRAKFAIHSICSVILLLS